MKKSSVFTKILGLIVSSFDSIVSKMSTPWREFLRRVRDARREEAGQEAWMLDRLGRDVPKIKKPALPRAGCVKALLKARKRHAFWLKLMHPEMNRTTRRDLCKKVTFAQSSTESNRTIYRGKDTTIRISGR